MKTRIEEKRTPVSKHPNAKMTPAQLARRSFKSALPRKAQNRTLSPMQALGEAFKLLDEFRSMVRFESKRTDTDGTLYAALVYAVPGAAQLACTITVPEPKDIGPFCATVFGLNDADFLGLVFVQVDTDATEEYKTVAFVVPFKSGPDAEARLLYARRSVIADIQAVLSGLGN